MTYRACWRIIAVLVASLGITLAILQLEPQQVAGFGADGLLVAVTLATVHRAAQAGPTRIGHAATQLICSAALGILVGIATAGLVSGAGVAALIVPAVLGATNPHIFRRMKRRSRHSSTARQADVTSDSRLGESNEAAGIRPASRQLLGGHDVPELSNEQLCRLWRSSYAQVINASSADELIQLSDIRRAVLDALAARDPVGFDKWFNAGARAASDPGRYVYRSEPRHSIDGDWKQD